MTPLSSSFPINEECTSITITSTGQLIVAGFTDGTIRLFDRTGTFITSNAVAPSLSSSSSSTPSLSRAPDSYEEENEFDTGNEETTVLDDAEGLDGSSFDDEDADTDAHDWNKQVTKTKKGSRSSNFLEVNSSYHQRYGAVACQIVAKGVHTALKLDCTISEDDQYCFASVLRGNMECVAIHIGPLVDRLSSPVHAAAAAAAVTAPSSGTKKSNLLDFIHVYRHSDAKLRGLGACTRLLDDTNDRPKYLLLTGKSIKNIHIWSYQPPPLTSSDIDTDQQPQPIWQCLYDCPTNGNTIQWLAFRRDDENKLCALSKSLHQKLRVWDVSYEEQKQKRATSTATKQQQQQQNAANRPTRPPYTDILNTECALGVAGNWIVCGGEMFNHQISIVALDASNNDTTTASIYNHTELALPPPMSTATSTATTNTVIDRRQQRGDMRCVIAVSGVQNHVVLELSDGNVAEYHVNDTDVDNTTASVTGISIMHSIPKLADNSWTRQFSVRQLHNSSSSEVILMIATFHSSRRHGTMLLQPLLHHYNIEEITDKTFAYNRSTHQTSKTKNELSQTTPSETKPKQVKNVPSTDRVAFSDQSNKEVHRVITTTKKLKKKHRLSVSSTLNTDSSNNHDVPFVSTIKKKQKMKISNDLTIPFQTPNSTGVDKGTIPKKTPSVKNDSTDKNLYHLKSGPSSASFENVTRKETSFVTPYPNKSILPTPSTSQSQSSTDSKETTLTTSTTGTKNRSNDYVLSTIYKVASSGGKNVSITPAINRTETITIPALTKGVSVDDNKESSPSIPRKRTHMYTEKKNEGKEAPSSPTTSIIVHQDRKQDGKAIIDNSPQSSLATSTISTSDIFADHRPMMSVHVNSSAKSKTPMRSPKPTPPSKPNTPIASTTVREQIIDLCYNKLEDLESYEVKVSNLSTFLSSLSMSQQVGTSIGFSKRTNPYNKTYRSMIAHHYASHLQIRKRIIDATRATIYSVLDAPIASSFDKAQGFLHSALLRFEELVNEMMQLQRMEAYTVHSLQQQHQQDPSALIDTVSDQDVAIPFSFPTIFQDVMAFLPGTR